ATGSRAVSAPLESTAHPSGALMWNRHLAFRSGCSKQAVGGLVLRVQVDLVVHRVGEPVQPLAGPAVRALAADGDHVVGCETVDRHPRAVPADRAALA